MNSILSRRRFLAGSSLALGSAAIHGMWDSARLLAAEAASAPALRFGLITDIHYADKAPAGTRYYRDALPKVQAAIQSLNAVVKQDRAGMSFAAVLGDLVDSAAAKMTEESIATELGYLKTIEAELAKINTERHYILGNHCVEALTKAEFFENTKAKPAPYSFDMKFPTGEGAIHCIGLDACFNSKGEPYGRKNSLWNDANLPESQIAWLENDLAQTKNPVILFVHQRLEGASDYLIKPADKIRGILQRSGKVLAVFQGHSHQNSLAYVEGIPYCVIRAVIDGAGADNNSFAVAEIYPDYSIGVRGSFQQKTYDKFEKKAKV